MAKSSKNKSSWSYTYILMLHDHTTDTTSDKNIIRRAAKRYADAYLQKHALTIKAKRRFTNGHEQGFTTVAAGCLGHVTLDDRLMIFAHGSDTEMGPYKARKLADKLYGWGLRTAGLIDLRACDVGTGDFPDCFIRACHNKILFGFLKAYMGSSVTHSSGTEVISFDNQDGDEVYLRHDESHVHYPGTAANAKNTAMYTKYRAKAIG
jgi:hypothetical protein